MAAVVAGVGVGVVVAGGVVWVMMVVVYLVLLV